MPTEPGPELARLLRRLAETPPEFLLEPQLGAAGAVTVAAVVNDVLQQLGGAPLTAGDARYFAPAEPGERGRLRLTLLAAWLLSEPWFVERGGLAGAALRYLKHDLAALAKGVAAEKCVTDAERREEFARHCLRQLELRPDGENEAEAQDRWTTVSSAERRRVVAAAQAAEKRAREVREAMARQEALDAQMKASRE